MEKIRKITDIDTIHELDISEKIMTKIVSNGHSVQDIITAAREQKLKSLQGITPTAAEKILKAVDQAGFILHESAVSSGMRSLLSKAYDYQPRTPEEYEGQMEFSKDQQEVFRQMLDYLTEREMRILTLLFGLDGQKSQSCAVVAQPYHLSVERVRQIKEKALRKLRQRQLVNMAEKAFPEFIIGSNLVKTPKQYEGPTEQMPLEFLGLSTKAYHDLLRAGFKIVADLQQLSYDDLSQIRGIGQGSQIEIYDCLHKIGLNLKDA